MTYSNYTNAFVTGRQTTFRAQHNLPMPLWLLSDGDDTIRQTYGAQVNLPASTRLYVGAGITWTNGPTTDTVVHLDYGELTLTVVLTSVTVNGIMTVTVTPDPTPIGLSRRLKFVNGWGDGVEVVEDDRTVTAGDPAYSFSAPVQTRPGATSPDAYWAGMSAFGATPAPGELERFFTQPYAMGDFTMEFTNLRLDGDHLDIDWNITNGALNPATLEHVYVAAQYLMYGARHGTANGFGRIYTHMGSTGTLHLNEGYAEWAEGGLQPFLYREYVPGAPDNHVTRTDVENYCVQAVRIFDGGFGSGDDVVGWIPTTLSQHAIAPFTRNAGGNVVYPEPVKDVHTLTFDWDPGGIAT